MFGIGIFVLVAAGCFWLLGLLPLLDVDWYHKVNYFFFYLAFAFLVVGPVYAVLDRKGKAFSREVKDEGKESLLGDEENSVKKDEESAPTPYVMLSA